MYYPINHYVLILQNNYTKQVRIFDVYNTSDDKDFYKFDFTFPEDLPMGEYNYALFWDVLEYRIDFSNDLLSSKLTVVTDEGDTVVMKLSDINPDTGIIVYGDEVPKGEQSIDNKVNYYSL